VQNLPSRVPLP